MNFSDLQAALIDLGFQTAIGFAAAQSERAVKEVERLFPKLVADHPVLKDGVEILWRTALGEALNYVRDVQPVHVAISGLLPKSPDDPVDPALRYAAQAISYGMVALARPQEFGKYAALAGDAVGILMAMLYEDGARLRAEEKARQEQAIGILQSRAGSALQRNVLDGLPDYARDGLSEEYLARENW